MAELSETEISNKKLAAGLLGIFLGSFGIHIVDVKEESSVAVLTDVHTTIGMDGEKVPVSVTQNPF